MGLYIALAIGYNLMSIVWKDVTGKAFAPTDPITGITIMAGLYACYLLLDQIPNATAFVILLAFIVLIARYGIWQHATNFDSKTYLSRATWLLAMTVNVFGVGILVWTLLKRLS